MKIFRASFGAAMLLAALASCSSDARHGNPLTLPSGRVVRVLAVVPMHYTNGNALSLMFQYETDLQVSDLDNLTKEADDIWSVLQNEAENGNFTSAIVSAREIPHGVFVKNASGYNFVYQKGADGRWQRLKKS